jgi:hypothetical protein
MMLLLIFYRPSYRQDTLDLFATMITSMELTTHKQYFKSFPNSFTTLVILIRPLPLAQSAHARAFLNDFLVVPPLVVMMPAKPYRVSNSRNQIALQIPEIQIESSQPRLQRHLA